MALRVLLADESSTIKKVFQLALQDFAVEVKPVNIGVDVLPVAKTFAPDIIFADVLLQKKSGYDVCAELKSDPNLGRVPIVLMWSGFMELDEDKFQAAQANGRLEKPFDVATLRKLVTELVPKTQGQRISQFLKFPQMPDLEEPKAPTPPKREEEFQQVPIPKMKSGADKFRVTPVDDDDANIPVNLTMPNDPIDVENIFREVDEPEEFTMRDTRSTRATPPPAPEMRMPPPPPVRGDTMKASAMDLGGQTSTNINQKPARPAPVAPPAPKAAQTATLPQLTQDDIEKIVRTQTLEIVEAAVWKIVPELAKQILEREIQKLLKEKDSHL